MRCQRCGRPVCPECQRPAAVGVQCVDCVAVAAQADRATVTAFGGRAAGERPVVTLTLIGICVAAFIGQLVRPELTYDFGFAPIVGWVEPWRFVTALFLHSPSMYMHILFNMFALWSLGPYLEPLLGRARFAMLYLVSGFGGMVAVVLLAGGLSNDVVANDGWRSLTVGASGAIFGLFGALLVLNRALGRDSTAMYGVLAINAVFGFIYPNISWQAHLGGFVTGLVCAGLIAALRGRERARHVWPALIGVFAVLVAIVVARYLMLPEVVRDPSFFG